MNAHTRKTLKQITGHPAPRDLDWGRFETLWNDVADSVENESGDRLAVSMNGHRVVFHRPHDGWVSIEDVERARHLLADHPEAEGSGHVIAVAIDAESARILDFDLGSRKVADTEQDVRDQDARSRHLRTVERHSGHEDVQDLDHYFDRVAEELRPHLIGHRFVVLGHGSGKSDVAAGFVTRLEEKHGSVAEMLGGTGSVDLSAANDSALEEAAERALSRG